MAFVDDDEEEDFSVSQSASNYYFEDDDKEPVPFSRLPIQWSENEKVDGSGLGLYLRGRTDNGLLPLHKLVKAWKFDLDNFRPEISVLTKDRIWIKLEEPRKSYGELIRTLLVTLYSMQFLRRNPEASEKSLWDKLARSLRSYDVNPSQNDMVDHIDLITEAVKRDVKLAKSNFILAFLEKPTKKRLPVEDNAKDDFIVGDDGTFVASDEDELDDEDDDFFESVCAICDNGGELLCCEGSCLRSFHPTKKDGEDSLCESLGLTKMEVEAIQKFFCQNCKRKIHQCFICKNLGSSDNSAGAAEVFQCVSATCGYFYHPRCVTRMQRLGSKEESESLERQIIAGEFTCPLHKCSVCENGEVKTDSNLQFAVCRRCPKSYHRKCLPREISFEDIEDEGIFTRAWDGLLHNRVLIYCPEHEIDEELLTPVRDHVKFPITKEVFLKEKRRILESHVGRVKERPRIKDPALQDTCGKVSLKSSRSPFSSSKDGVSRKKHESVSSVRNKKRKYVDSSIKYNTVPQKSQKMMEESREAGKSKLGVKEAREAGKSNVSLGERRFNYLQEPGTAKRGPVIVDSKHNETESIASKEPGSEIPTLDKDSERKLVAVMRKASEEITMGTILRKFNVQSSTHTSSSRNVVDKTITMGKVEGSVQAVRTALKKLEEGGNIEDAKAVCEPEVLSQILKWKDKLKVYLAPFLHGPRYTSFGRHFTNPHKLQQIVDRLHWYADDGDMIVDFCCGANDFSCLMKTKLEEMGKKCLYKNYDLFQAKNNFNFERKDWMTVSKDELEPGSKLIMGLNPPFGVNAYLANKFINKALEFLPKILILIVPPETERLDKKKSPYELIWEDKTFLSGNSFYLPGSVNDEDKQLEDWNNVPPPLSLWSRPDFAAKHKKIAEKHYHLSRDMGSSKLMKIEEESTSLRPIGASDDGMCDDNPMPRDSPFEISESAPLEKEDVPMEIDEELEVADCVNKVLLSEKIEARETVAHGHHLDHLSSRSQLKKEKRNKDYSDRNLGKSVDSNNVNWKNTDMEEDQAELNRAHEHQSDHLSRRSQLRKDQGELNRAPERAKVKIPEMTSDRQSPVRSSPDDIYAVCTSISNTTPQRSHESIEASLPAVTRTRSNLGKNIKEPDTKLQSSREDIFTVRRSPESTSQKPFEAVEPSYGGSYSHFDDGLAAKYGFDGGYTMPDPPFIPDQYPMAPSMRNGPNELFDFRGYSDLTRSVGPRGYQQQYVGHLNSMLAPPPPPNLMDNSFSLQQRYAPHFDQMDYQRMSSFPTQPPMQPSGHNLLNPHGFPLQPPPPPSDLSPRGFAPGPHPNYPYMSRSGGWIND